MIALRTTALWLVVLGLFIFLAGCGDLAAMLPEPGHNTARTPGPTIDEHFGQKIDEYEESVLAVRVECESGTCPPQEPRPEPVRRACYFCDQSRFEGNEFALWTEGVTGSNTLAGCTERESGPIIDGLGVSERTAERVVLTGEVRYRAEQISGRPGACPDSDYKYTLIQEVQWVFRPPTAP